jgi:cation-dependent mannose-6-phosphate receptor
LDRCKLNSRPSVLSSYPSLLVAILTWFFGHTFYNRLYLGRRGIEQFPIPSSLPFSLPSVSLPKFGSRSAGPSSQASKPAGAGFGWRRSSQRRGYSNIRADEDDEEDGFAGRFSLEDDDDLDEPRDLTEGLVRENALGGETDAWRAGGAGAGANVGATGGGKSKPAEGLVDL